MVGAGGRRDQREYFPASASTSYFPKPIQLVNEEEGTPEGRTQSLKSASLNIIHATLVDLTLSGFLRGLSLSHRCSLSCCRAAGKDNDGKQG
jgi:hypothetical protein